jgi:glucose/arabinose dehydrogenase
MAIPRALRALPLIALVQVGLPRVAQAIVLDPAFEETVLLPDSGRAGTTAMGWMPDGTNRLLLTRQLGQVILVDAGALKGFVSIAPVFNGSECGVLGLAFDPRFAENQFVYVFVTVSRSEQQIIRYRVEGNVAVEPTIIVSGLPTRGANHDGGSLGFGPDGKLYWSIGDLGNGFGSGPDLTTLGAKVSRANLDGSAPEDNPFFDGDGPNDDRIWARGFRNPFSFTWQPATDRLWVNTVGARVEQIFSPEPGDDAGWPTYENNQPEPFLQPILAYPTGGSVASALAADGATRAGGVASFTTTLPHGLRVGASVTVGGVADASFNGQHFVSAVSSPTIFSVAQSGPDAASSGGAVTLLDLGNAVTGGTFWDSSSVPAAYRGNFFFGDYGSGNIARVTFGPDYRIASVALFATASRLIDLAVGPDGDVYYATFQGSVHRIHYNAAAQGIVTSQLHVTVPEAGQAVFSVRLAVPPTEPIAIGIERTGGDVDVDTEQGELVFDASNWSVPQPVHVAAQADDDAANDSTELTLSSPGLPDEIVEARVTDDDQVAILAAPPEVTLVEGIDTELSVVLNGAPATPVEVTLTTDDGSPLGLDPRALIFDKRDWAEPQTVMLSASSVVAGETITLTGRSLIPAEVHVTVSAEAPDTAGEAGAPPLAAGAGADEPYAGTSGEPAGGQSGGGAPNGMTQPSSSTDSGCGCRLPRGSNDSVLVGWLFAMVALTLRRRALPP